MRQSYVPFTPLFFGLDSPLTAYWVPQFTSPEPPQGARVFSHPNDELITTCVANKTNNEEAKHEVF